MRWMPPLAATHLAALYNHVEAGGQWPPQMRVARVAFLNTTAEQQSLDARSYRLIMVASYVYRRWGCIGIRHVNK